MRLMWNEKDKIGFRICLHIYMDLEIYYLYSGACASVSFLLNLSLMVDSHVCSFSFLFSVVLEVISIRCSYLSLIYDFFDLSVTRFDELFVQDETMLITKIEFRIGYIPQQ
jgi:hypothetical protein